MANIDAGAAMKASPRRGVSALWPLLRPPPGFIRSRGGIVFAVLCGVSAVLGATVGYLYFNASLDSFMREKSGEHRTAFALTKAFVSTYAQVTGGAHPSELPIPHAFAMRAIEKFTVSHGADDGSSVSIVGLPGREIAFKAADPDIAAALAAMASQRAPAAREYLYETSEGPVLRTLYPLMAAQQNCVDCHNRLQAGGPGWKLNDLMGALFIEMPAASALSGIRRDAALLGTAVFLASALLAFHLMALVFRWTRSETERRSHALLAEAVEGLRDGISLYDPQGRKILTTPARPHAHDPATLQVAQEPDGRWLQIRESRTASGNLVRVESDITEPMLHEAALRRAKDEAESANRAKSEFLAMMSHELRTPLNAIIGFSDVMNRQTFGKIAPRYRVYANDIHESGQHLLRIISDILDLSKLDAGKAELAETVCDVAETVKRCRRLIIERAERGSVTLSAAFPPDLPWLWADKVKLRQIILNLLSNAVKFTAPGGEVTITAKDLGTGEATGGLAIEIADNGIGMAPEDIPAAFAPFRQLDNRLGRKYEGMGLGLPVCKMLIELHGGTLELTSEVDAGTVARVRFPAWRRRPPLARALPPEQETESASATPESEREPT